VPSVRDQSWSLLANHRRRHVSDLAYDPCARHDPFREYPARPRYDGTRHSYWNPESLPWHAPADLVGIVLVAAVAGVTTVIIALMAGGAR